MGRAALTPGHEVAPDSCTILKGLKTRLKRFGYLWIVHGFFRFLLHRLGAIWDLFE